MSRLMNRYDSRPLMQRPLTFTEVQLAFSSSVSAGEVLHGMVTSVSATDPASVTVASVKKTDAACVLIYRYILPSRQAVTAEILN